MADMPPIRMNTPPRPSSATLLLALSVFRSRRGIASAAGCGAFSSERDNWSFGVIHARAPFGGSRDKIRREGLERIGARRRRTIAPGGQGRGLAVGAVRDHPEQRQAIDALGELLTWSEGAFSFHPASDRERPAISFDLQNVMLEVFRIADERTAEEDR